MRNNDGVASNRSPHGSQQRPRRGSPGWASQSPPPNTPPYPPPPPRQPPPGYQDPYDQDLSQHTAQLYPPPAPPPDPQPAEPTPPPNGPRKLTVARVAAWRSRQLTEEGIRRFHGAAGADGA